MFLIQIKFMNTYSTVKVSGVIISIGKNTEIKGYTETILESFLPTDEELAEMDNRDIKKWTKINNIRMERVCEFLNENNL